MNRFQNFSAAYQWSIAIFCTGILVALLGWWIGFVSEHKIAAALIFIMVPVIQFLITPLLYLLSFYIYYSPMVVSMGSNNRVIDIHNGTSFNYMMEMKGVSPGKEWERKMLKYYLEALLNIVDKIENNKLSESVVIRGSSYFFSERTVQKFGFKVSKTSFAERVNIFLNYMDLIWMYSLSKGKFILPRLSNTKTISIIGTDLIKNKAQLNTLFIYFQRT